VLYLAFRIFYPAQYVGAKSLSWGGLQPFLSTVWKFSINGIYLRAKGSHLSSVPAQALLLTFIAIAGIGAALCARSRAAAGQGKWKLAYLVAGISLFIFLPNILFGLTDRYRTWSRTDPYYIGSYYSSFATCLALAVAFYALAELGVRRRNIGAMIGLAASLVFVAVVSVLNHRQSIVYFSTSREQAINWSSMSALAEEIKSGRVAGPLSRLCTTTLIRAPDAYNYWSIYLSEHSKRHVKVIYGFGDGSCDAIIEIGQDAHTLLSPSGQVMWKFPLSRRSR